MSEEKKALDAQVEALTKELDAVRAQLEAAAAAAQSATAELQKRDAERMVETHVSAGRIPQARRGEWVERAVRLGVEEVGRCSRTSRLSSRSRARSVTVALRLTSRRSR